MRLRWPIVLVAVAFLLAACSSPSPGASSPEESTPEATESADPTPEPVAETESPAGPEMVSVLNLEIGDCISVPQDQPPDGSVGLVERYDCDVPHDYEVYSAWDWEDGPYPGTEALETSASGRCQADFEAYVGISYSESVLYFEYLYPSDATWADGDREILCLLYLPDEQLEGSMAGAAI